MAKKNKNHSNDSSAKERDEVTEEKTDSVETVEDSEPEKVKETEEASPEPEKKHSKVPDDALAFTDYGDRIVFVDRNGRKQTIER